MYGIGNKDKAAITISILMRAGIVPSWRFLLEKGYSGYCMSYMHDIESLVFYILRRSACWA
jgi:hypothetical protein